MLLNFSLYTFVSKVRLKQNYQILNQNFSILYFLLYALKAMYCIHVEEYFIIIRLHVSFQLCSQ